MNEKLHLIILTPYGRYLENDVDFLEVRSEMYSLGITASHSPLISTVDISKMRIKTGDNEKEYAVGGGVLRVEKDKTTLVLNSIESAEEIDIERAQAAKERAENRLANSSNNKEAVDVNRAKLALLRALNRLNLKNKD